MDRAAPQSFIACCIKCEILIWSCYSSLIILRSFPVCSHISYLQSVENELFLIINLYNTENFLEKHFCWNDCATWFLLYFKFRFYVCIFNPRTLDIQFN